MNHKLKHKLRSSHQHKAGRTPPQLSTPLTLTGQNTQISTNKNCTRGKPHKQTPRHEIQHKHLLLTFQGKIITWKSTNETGGRSRSHSEAISAGISRVPKREPLQQERRTFHTYVLSVTVIPKRRMSSAFGSRILNTKTQGVSLAITQFGSSAEQRYSQVTSRRVLFLHLMDYNNFLYYHPPICILNTFERLILMIMRFCTQRTSQTSKSSTSVCYRVHGIEHAFLQATPTNRCVPSTCNIFLHPQLSQQLPYQMVPSFLKALERVSSCSHPLPTPPPSIQFT